jgi:RNA polymerase sigma factor (sigma-70 family)
MQAAHESDHRGIALATGSVAVAIAPSQTDERVFSSKPNKTESKKCWELYVGRGGERTPYWTSDDARPHKLEGCPKRIMGPAPGYVDEAGEPLDQHVQEVLRALLPRFRRDFPTIRDETIIADIMESAGRRVAAAERRLGRRLEKSELAPYAFVTIRSVAVSRVRLNSFAQANAELTESTGILSAVPATIGSPEAMEREILLREILAMLAPEERRIVILKSAGFSSEEIGERVGASASSVDMQYSRLRARIRAELMASDRSRQLK